jgi:ribosomal protein S18 acetylase RimI-like enzyme
MIDYKVKNSKEYDKQNVFELIKKLDQYFVPSLSERVNLLEYVNKLDQHANMVLAYNENENLIGVIAFYDNDLKSKIAFISVLGVLPNYQGQGVASMLVNKCIKECRLSAMKKIIVKTEIENSKAMNFYKKIGFNEEEKLYEFGVEKIQLQLDLRNQ